MSASALAVPARLRSSGGFAVGLVLGSCLSLQVGAAFAVRLFPRVGSAGAVVWRLGLAAAVLSLMVRPDVRRWSRQQWWSVGGLGFSFAGMNGMFYAAIDRIPMGAAVTVEFLGPLALAACTSARRRDLSWVALAAAGVTLLGLGSHADGAGGTGLDGAGVALALGAGAFWALYIVMTARVGAAVPGRGGLAIATAIGAALVLPVGAAGAVRALTHPGWLAMALGMALLASVVPYSLELAALRRLPAAVFGVLLSLEPAIATGCGWLLLGQRAGVVDALAVVIVVAASVGSTLSHRARTALPSPSPVG